MKLAESCCATAKSTNWPKAVRSYGAGTLLQVVEWRGRTVGLSICADSWRTEITDALCLMGANLIFSPSALGGRQGRRSHESSRGSPRTYRQRISQRELHIVAPNGVVWSRKVRGRGACCKATPPCGPGGVVQARGKTTVPELICCRIS
jgi:hypothetical protein